MARPLRIEYPGAYYMMHNRIAEESKRNKRLKGRINIIRNQIFKI